MANIAITWEEYLLWCGRDEYCLYPYHLILLAILFDLSPDPLGDSNG